MSWITVIEEATADGILKQVYQKVRHQRGRIANIYKAQSLNPQAIEAHLSLYMAIMYGNSPLSRAQREMIAVLVSALNNCHYCITHHGEALDKYIKETSVIEGLHRGIISQVSSKERVLLEYAAKLTKNPSSIEQFDIDNLRKAGLTDREILDATLIASYFNFVNRIVEGLGVELEETSERVYKY